MGFNIGSALRKVGIDPFKMLNPLTKSMKPESVRKMVIWLLKDGVWGEQTKRDNPALRMKVWGRDFPNPIGISSGFDTGAEIIDDLINVGYGFGEVGTITPIDENVKRETFRLEKDDGLLCRTIGYNNVGAKEMSVRLAARRGRPAIVGVSVGENAYTQDAIEDYEKTIRSLAPYADYVVVNISTPTIQSLLQFQIRDDLAKLMERTRKALNSAAPISTPPLLLKVALELSDLGIKDTAELALEHEFDGLIVAGASSKKPKDLKSRNKKEGGGLSGKVTSTSKAVADLLTARSAISCTC